VYYYTVEVATALSVMFIASAQDLKEREVSDILWIAGGAVAFFLLFLGMATSYFPVKAQDYFIPLLLLFLYLDIFIEWENIRGGKFLRYILGVLLGAGSIYALLFYFNVYAAVLAGMVAWYFFIVLLYRYDFIKGGADAKALIFLLILFPIYPVALDGLRPPLYVSVTFPLFLSVLLFGALLTLAIPIYNFALNLFRGDGEFPHMFLGFRKPVAAVDLNREWLLEVPGEGGERVRVRKLGAGNDSLELENIRKLGWNRVWVSPKIPFIVPLTAGLLLVLVFGTFVSFL